MEHHEKHHEVGLVQAQHEYVKDVELQLSHGVDDSTSNTPVADGDYAVTSKTWAVVIVGYQHLASPALTNQPPDSRCFLRDFFLASPILQYHRGTNRYSFWCTLKRHLDQFGLPPGRHCLFHALWCQQVSSPCQLSPCVPLPNQSCSDLFGRRYFILAGNVLVFIGAILGGTSKSLGQTIAAHVLFGFGGCQCQLAAFAAPELLPNKWRHFAVVIADAMVLFSVIVGPPTARIAIRHDDAVSKAAVC
jgi:hypothetical protein